MAIMVEPKLAIQNLDTCELFKSAYNKTYYPFLFKAGFSRYEDTRTECAHTSQIVEIEHGKSTDWMPASEYSTC